MDTTIEYWFYHLTHTGLDGILPDILEKTYIKGWTADVRIGALVDDPKRELTRLDSYLWSYKKAGFLPHGRADEPGADSHPILLSTGTDPIENRNVTCLLYGADLPEMSGVERCITLFTDASPQEKSSARKRWKQASDAGAKTAYWAQDDYGKWIQPLQS